MSEKKLKGSQLNLQLLVNNPSSELNKKISSKFPQLAQDSIIWQSPLKKNDYAELFGNSFWNIIKEISNITDKEIKNFWPQRGRRPTWDALATTQQKRIILVEAKAHRGEEKSGTRAKGESLSLIKESLEATKKWLGITCDNDWQKCYYQMSNRLAHLYFLKEVCKLDVYLVYVYFLGDTHFSDKVGTEKDWKIIIDAEKDYLGISDNKILENCFADVFLDIPKK